MPERAFKKLGDILTKALVSGDFDLYRSVLCLPMKFTPRDGQSYVLPDEAALREDFDLYVSIIRLHGVTDIYRQFISFEPAGPGELYITCMTHILVRANLLAEPFASRMLVQHDAAGWRIKEIESSEGHLNWSLGRATVTSDGKFQSKS
ncbi:hypothetical protein GC209_08965 [bacterium]|nr:hypothetical protein [bacterium]